MNAQQFLETKGDVKEYVTKVAESIEIAGLKVIVADKTIEILVNAKSQSGFEAVAGICSASSSVEPLVLPHMATILAEFANKDKAIGAAAVAAANAFVDMMCPWGIPLLVPALIEAMGGKAKPAHKENCLKIFTKFAAKGVVQTGRCLVDLVPAISDQMWDIKKEVKQAANEAMAAVLECTGNKDLIPFLPTVLESIQEPKKVAECVEKLAGCVFVQNVESPALAIMTPVLVRGLNERQEEVKRKCCVIIDNMCKLVDEPNEVLPLMPKLQPLLAKCVDGISDPEARSVAERAYKTLTKSGGEGVAMKSYEGAEMQKMFESAMEKAVSDKPSDEGFAASLAHLANLAAAMTNGFCFEEADWDASLLNQLAKFISASEAKVVVASVLEQCRMAAEPQEEEEEDEEGVELYKGTFSLAYGSITLLNNTKLSLKRNKFYGLLGPNNCGKTTMMRAIANEQVEGFPKRDELRTIFVEHEIQEREVGEDENRYPILNIDLSGTDWVVDTCNNVYQMEPKVTKEQVIEIMEDIGFGNSARNFGKDRAADTNMGITTYSGGWKMKMQLCAATLMNADILMLDEPTGHLDIKNIAWLEGFLKKFMSNGGSVICTSHDPTFLNRMCTHIIDFQDRKLKMFRGECGSALNDWVAKYPEKQGYFELKNDVVKFVFPKPGSLEGVKSKTKAIMKMSDVTFQYPTRDTPTVFDIGLQVSQVSRVAVIGPNGAGKSTAIKLLNGELKPSKGTIWQHPNMRLAYVAQHAFHHLEKHLNKTPSQYIMWRFAGNDDKESLEFTSQELNDEDEARQAVKWFLDPKQSYKLRKCEEKADEKLAVVPESVLKRRENKKEKTKEYEVKWQFKPLESSSWVDRDTLIKMGYIKMVQRKDEQEAAAAGLMTKPLTQQAIEKHLGDFGIEPEAASHTLIQALSGGQKVKVVLAASMWQNPHLVILDEPTNYLDRDGLGALTKAIEAYEGGVIIISHNREFANAVSQEKWVMEAGRLRREGESIAKEDENANTNVAPDDIIDASGNVIKVKAQKSLSDKEKKSELKNIEKKLRENKKKNNLSEEEYWELHDRQEELKSELGK